MRGKLSSVCGVAFAGIIVAALSASAASATTVDFTFKDGVTDVATGSFTFSSANPVIGFADLDTFDIQIGVSHYDLTFVNTSPYNDNTYLSYIVGTGFDHAPQPGLFGIDTTLVAMSNGFNGFIFTYGPDDRYFTDSASGVYHQAWTDLVFQQGISVDDTPVPEPITLSLFGAGLAGAAALRRRKTKVA